MPEGLREIASFSFYACAGLEKVTIPDSVSVIDDYAFGDCSRLEAVRLPENLQYIGDDAFRECITLQSVAIPDSVEFLGYSCFDGCESLRHIGIGEGTELIAPRIFGYSGHINVWDEEKPDVVYYHEAAPITEKVVIELPYHVPVRLKQVEVDDDDSPEKKAEREIWRKDTFGIENRKNLTFIVHRGSPMEEMIKKYQFKDGKEMYEYRYYDE